ncbi:MAG TPA: 2-keto-3-deoxygluconate permease, partial [Trichococcus flocculiformis]|nr:2-keto-3-deoxygluconate permease [Trichococcus flocculiformis]
GDSINLFQAAKAGLAGIILSVLFYIILLPTLYFTETKLLKANGLSAIALTSVAGVSLAAPSVIAQAYPELEPIVPLVVSQIAMAVVITSVLTPMIANKIAKKKNLVKH